MSRESIATALLPHIWETYQTDGTAREYDAWRRAAAEEAVKSADELLAALSDRETAEMTHKAAHERLLEVLDEKEQLYVTLESVYEWLYINYRRVDPETGHDYFDTPATGITNAVAYALGGRRNDDIR